MRPAVTLADDPEAERANKKEDRVENLTVHSPVTNFLQQVSNSYEFHSLPKQCHQVETYYFKHVTLHVAFQIQTRRGKRLRGNVEKASWKARRLVVCREMLS